MIIDVKTGESVNICFRQLGRTDIKKYGLTIRNGWFDWKSELEIEQNHVFGLFVNGNNNDIQGVIALQEWERSQMVHISLMEVAPHNKYNHPNQQYAAVGKKLLAFAMHYSLSIPVFEGFVGLVAKKNYNEEYYLKLHAQLANNIDGKPYYYFDTRNSKLIVEQYLPGGVTICPN